ncbi:MAG: 2-oxoacid:acceptor oxidoreductase subunit alpha, partial [Proteobacteria bacterium]|nr:2-oxoacid:acceptor oxidoreductase subunit alpha [Pseudomonadota bacterium]
TARRLAEAFRTPVLLLTDTNMATGVQPYFRPDVNTDWFPPPIDQSEWDRAIRPYEWDHETGLSPRPIPGQKGGHYVLTGLAHTEKSGVAYDPDSNQRGCEMRSRKLAALQKTLKPPIVHGDPEGDLLVIGWGSTLGSIEEAVDRARADGHKVSSLHLRFLSPLEPGLEKILPRFKKVLTVEINYSDPEEIGQGDIQRRYAQLATLLRGTLLMDIDCWSNVHGQPIQPGLIYDELIRRLT